MPAIAERSFRPSRRGVICAACAAAMTRLPGAAHAAPAARGGIQAAEPFGYDAVRLTGGAMKAQYDRVHTHYLALDNDRLLKVYRQHAGLPAPGLDMGGWYDADGFVPGHTLGQYISGLARIGASTGDGACHAKARELVAGFAEALARNPNPFAGPKAETVWPAYILDKHVIGLIDAYELSGDEQAKALLPQVIEAGLKFVSPVSRDRIGKKDPPYDETYVLPENLFEVARITGEARYADLARKYMLDRELFDPLARGEDVLPGKHAYSHAIALSSAGKAYQVDGDVRRRAALVNAWRFLELQRYASGGWGPDEQFIRPHTGALYDSLKTTTAHFETPCGAYASMKLHRYLTAFTADPRYGDGLERVVYNTLMAVRPPDSDGDYPYYSTYSAGAQKTFYASKWPCCSGTLVQGVADYVLNLYFHSADGIYVNLYAPSTVRWTAPGGAPVTLAQETDYPSDGLIRLRVEPLAPAEFAVRLRIPAWMTQAAEIRVNGRPAAADSRPGRYAEIRRVWRPGDVVELQLDQPLRVEAIDETHPDTVAVMRGGVMYVGLDPWPGLDQARLALPGGLAPLAGRPDAFIQRVGGQELVFVPFHQVQDERYSTYFLKA